MKPPLRFGGFLGLMTVSVATVAMKAQLGNDPHPVGLSVARPTLSPVPVRTVYVTRPPTTVTIDDDAVTSSQTTAPQQAPRPGSTGSRSITGDLLTTEFGPMQVRVVLTGARITDVVALAVPDLDPESAEISRTSIPQLRAQVLAAQSSDIDGVSGATYTAQAYALSVQSALDRA